MKLLSRNLQKDSTVNMYTNAEDVAEDAMVTVKKDAAVAADMTTMVVDTMAVADVDATNIR